MCLITERKMTPQTQHHHIRRSDGLFICLPAALTMFVCLVFLLYRYPNCNTGPYAILFVLKVHHCLLQQYYSDFISDFYHQCSISHNRKEATAEFVFFRKSNSSPQTYDNHCSYETLYLQSVQ